MSAVPPISDALSSTSRSLVLPPSSTNQASANSVSGTSSNPLVLPPSSAVQGSQSANSVDPSSSNSLVLPASSTSTGVNATGAATTDPSTAAALSTPTPPLNTATQPLNVVFNALASAGVDAAITQNILAPEAAAANGTLSVFLGTLFDALAAQSVAEQAAQANAAQTNATNSTNAADAATSSSSSTSDQTGSAAAAGAFLANSNTTTPNSALENGVQTLAQTVNSQTAVSTAVTANADAQAANDTNNSLSPLQQSFDQFLSDAGGTAAGPAALGNFLGALASNLHTAPSPLGNIVNAQT